MDSTLVKELNDLTGCGTLECKKALLLAKDDLELAWEYLRLKTSAVMRYKTVNGEKKPFGISDYLNLAKERLNRS